MTAFLLLVGMASFAGATQDIVVDAYRIEIAPLEAQAALAATYTLGYRVGADPVERRRAGAVATCRQLADRLSGDGRLMLLPVAGHPAGHASRPAATGAARSMSGAAFVQPFAEFFSRNGVALALGLLAFVGLFKLPDQMIGVLAGPFYLDSGYTKTDIATVSKLYGVWIGIAGAFLGGVGVAHVRYPAHAGRGGHRGGALQPGVPADGAESRRRLWAFFAAISADNLSQGFAGTVLVAFMSGLTNRELHRDPVRVAGVAGQLCRENSSAALSGFIVEASQLRELSSCSARFPVVPTLALLAWLWPRIVPRDRPTAVSLARPPA